MVFIIAILQDQLPLCVLYIKNQVQKSQFSDTKDIGSKKCDS